MSERPKTSTRDYEQLRDQLQDWLKAKLAPDAHPGISSIQVPPSSGMSSDTVLFDITMQESGQTRILPCVARLAPDSSAVPIFPKYDLEKEFRVMQLVASTTDVPVPRPLWFEGSEHWLGSPFIVIQRVEGQAPPDVMPYNFGSWLSMASPQEQQRLQEETIRVIAKLHEVRPPQADLSFLQFSNAAPSTLQRHIEEQRAYYQWVTRERRVPLLERCFAWLEEHLPEDSGEDVLSWGDSRIGNILYQDFRPVGVLDWELAAVGPRELDLGWLIFLHRFFEDIAVMAGLPGMPDFLRKDDVAATYEKLSGHKPRNLDFFIFYAALRHGIIIAKVHQRKVLFGEMVAVADPDDSIMHRAALEKMLAGTYTY